MPRKTSKNLFIILLIILLLLLAVGYAVFSDTLTISGTANANGKFDLEFQNVRIISFAGIEESNINTQIVDGNRLNIKIDNLQYPGSGVEFSADIVNVGTIPAKVNEVGSFEENGKVTGLVEVKGLDAINTEHPVLEPNEKCNIHFTVEWPEGSYRPITEKNNSTTFGLEINYIQATDDIFSGKESHTHEEGNLSSPTYLVPNNITAEVGQTLNDIKSQLPEGYSFQNDLTTSVGNTIGEVTFKATYTPSDTGTYSIVKDIDIPVNVVKTGKLIELIDGDDYGKNVDYSININGVDLNNWRIFNNNGTNVQIILEKYLPHNAIPQEYLDAGVVPVSSDNEYGISANTPKKLFAIFNMEGTAFVNKISGATARITPSVEEFVESWNANPVVNKVQLVLERDNENRILLYDETSSDYFAYNMIDTSRLYLPYITSLQNNHNLKSYWLSSKNNEYKYCMVSYNKYIEQHILPESKLENRYSLETGFALRPIITLSSEQIGTLGETTVQLQLSE